MLENFPSTQSFFHVCRPQLQYPALQVSQTSTNTALPPNPALDSHSTQSIVMCICPRSVSSTLKTKTYGVLNPAFLAQFALVA